jgi:hypothetical protein
MSQYNSDYEDTRRMVSQASKAPLCRTSALKSCTIANAIGDEVTVTLSLHSYRPGSVYNSAALRKAKHAGLPDEPPFQFKWGKTTNIQP